MTNEQLLETLYSQLNDYIHDLEALQQEDDYCDSEVSSLEWEITYLEEEIAQIEGEIEID